MGIFANFIVELIMVNYTFSTVDLYNYDLLSVDLEVYVNSAS